VRGATPVLGQADGDEHDEQNEAADAHPHGERRARAPTTPLAQRRAHISSITPDDASLRFSIFWKKFLLRILA